MINVSNVGKEYSKKIVLTDFCYRFKDKGLYIITGASGCGKSTLLNIISNRDKNYTGVVEKNDDIFYLKVEDLIGNFTIKEHIELMKELYPSFVERKNKYGLEKNYNKCIDKLSMGEKQRLCIYLSICCNFKIVLLDEPLSSLDYVNKKRIISDINKESRERLFIIVSHELEGFVNYIEIKLDIDRFCSVDDIKIKNAKCNERGKINYRKWGSILIKKNFFSLFMFVLAISSLAFSFLFINEKIWNMKEEFDLSFLDGELYYKENNSSLNEENFYNEIILPLSREIDEYGLNLYDEKMYEHGVYVGEYYIDNGFLFSNIIEMEGLKWGEIVLGINYQEFCFNNSILYCNKNNVDDLLFAKELVYRASEEYSFKIVDIVEGDNVIFLQDKSRIYDLLKNEINDYLQTYYINIKKDKLEEFYRKINLIDSLLKYDFNEYYKDEQRVYFLVREASNMYFSYEELKQEKLIGCNEIISCDVFTFTNISSIRSIDNFDFNGKIKFMMVDEYVLDNEVIISSSLSEVLKKKKGDYLTIKHYFNESLYVENVVINDVIESKENYLYHNSRYPYSTYNRLSGKTSRISFSYGESELFKSRSLIYSELSSEVKVIISGFCNGVRIAFLVLMLLMVIIMFFIENKKVKKHFKFYRFIKMNGCIYCEKIFNVYSFVYLIIGLYLIFFDIVAFLIYMIVFVIYYLSLKRKIKIQVSLD